MKNLLLLLVISSSLFFTACEADPELKSEDTESILGSWVNAEYNDSIYSFTRAAALAENEYGMTFISNNKFLERKNSGWCGTPPISYSDFTGNWTLSQSTLNISVKFWGGTAHYQWRIISVDHQKLVVKRMMEDYQYDK